MSVLCMYVCMCVCVAGALRVFRPIETDLHPVHLVPHVHHLDQLGVVHAPVAVPVRDVHDCVDLCVVQFLPDLPQPKLQLGAIDRACEEKNSGSTLSDMEWRNAGTLDIAEAQRTAEDGNFCRVSVSDRRRRCRTS